MAEIKDVAVYARVSTKMQTEKFSLPAQKRILGELCQKNNWDYQIYEDAGISGKNITDRPAMIKLLEDADEKKFQAICVIEWERLSRDIDLFDWMYIKKILRDNGIKVVTPSQTFDLQDDEDDFISDLFAILSKREKKKIIQRMMRGKVEAVQAGKYPGGNTPYGYYHNRETGTLEIDETQAEVIRLIFHLNNVENLSSEKIALLLTEKGIPTHLELTGKIFPNKNPHIKGWFDGTIRGILNNPVYYGKFAYMKKKGLKQRRKKEEWIYGSCPAIVSEKEFLLAQKLLKDRQKESMKNKKYEYLLASKLRCFHCGSTLHGITYTYTSTKRGKKQGVSQYPYYKCNGRRQNLARNCKLPYVKTKVIDDVVWELIRDAIQNPALIKAALFAEIDENAAFIDNEHLEKRLQQNKMQEERMMNAFTAGAITVQQLKIQNEKLLKEREELEQNLHSSQQKRDERVAVEGQFSKVEDLVNVVQDFINDLDFKKKKAILNLVVEKITLDDEGNVEVYCCIPLVDLEKLHEVMENSGDGFSKQLCTRKPSPTR